MKLHRRGWWMAFGLLSALLSGCAAGTASLIDFHKLERPTSPNNFLVCPAAFCKSADRESPVFEVSPERLFEATKRAVAKQDRTTLEVEDNRAGQLVFLQRSALMRFPDRIWIEIVTQGTDHSTLAVFSRSLYGYSDFGVNQARVLAWLEAITAEAAARPN